MANDAPADWDAFISYSRRNKEFAMLLAAALGAYRPPKTLGTPAKSLRIFLDQHDLGTGDYGPEIETQLARSRMLIVVCSPAARASTYVDDEVRRFVRLRGSSAVVPVLLAGLANNEASPAQADETAFPPALAEAMQMPLAVDYRGFDTRRDRVQRGGFEGPWHQLLAKLFGVGRAEIEQRERRRQRLRWRWIGGSAAALIGVLASALVLTLLARTEAERQRDLAEQRRRDAQARALNVRAEAALAHGGQGLQRALLLTLESLSSAWTAEAQALLLAQTDRLLPPPIASTDDQHGPILSLVPLPALGLLASQGVDRLVLRSLKDLKPVRELATPRAPGALRRLVLSPDGRWLLAGCAEQVACVWDTASWTVAWAPQPRSALTAAAFSPDSQHLAYAFDGPPQVQFVETGSWRDGAALPIDESNSEPIQGLGFDADGSALLVRTRSDLELHDLRTRRKLQEVDTHGGTAFVQTPDAGTVYVDDGSRSLRAVRLARDAAGTPRLSDPGEPLASALDTRPQASIGSDGRSLAFRTADRMVQLLGPQAGAPPRHADGGSAVVLAGTDRLVVGAQEGRIELFDLQPAAGPLLDGVGPKPPAAPAEQPARLALSRDGQQLAVTGADGITRVLAVADGRSLATLPGLEGARPLFSADGQWLLVVASGGLAVFATADWQLRWQSHAEGANHPGLAGLWLSPDGRWLLLQRAGQLERIALPEGRPAPPIALTEHLSELRAEPGGTRLAGQSSANIARGFGLRQPSMRRVWQGSDGAALGWRSFERDDLAKWNGVSWGRRADDAQGEWTRSEGGGELALVDAAAAWPVVPNLLAPPAPPAVRWLADLDAGGTALHAHALQRAVRALGPAAAAKPAWSADGAWLATLDGDGAAHLWPLAPTALVAQACDRLRRNLGVDEWRTAFGDAAYRRTCPALPEGR